MADSEMIEIARLDFMMYRVTCLVAKDGSHSHIRSVQINSDGSEIIREEEKSFEVGSKTYALFHQACTNAMGLYTSTEWISGMSKKGVEI